MSRGVERWHRTTLSSRRAAAQQRAVARPKRPQPPRARQPRAMLARPARGRHHARSSPRIRRQARARGRGAPRARGMSWTCRARVRLRGPEARCRSFAELIRGHARARGGASRASCRSRASAIDIAPPRFATAAAFGAASSSPPQPSHRPRQTFRAMRRPSAVAASRARRRSARASAAAARATLASARCRGVAADAAAAGPRGWCDIYRAARAAACVAARRSRRGGWVDIRLCNLTGRRRDRTPPRLVFGRVSVRLRRACSFDVDALRGTWKARSGARGPRLPAPRMARAGSDTPAARGGGFKPRGGRGGGGHRGRVAERDLAATGGHRGRGALG